jgi:hypothetical protein
MVERYSAALKLIPQYLLFQLNKSRMVRVYILPDLASRFTYSPAKFAAATLRATSREKTTSLKV